MRQVRYTLSWFLIVMAVLSGALGLSLRRYYHQTRLLAIIEDSGGGVFYSPSGSTKGGFANVERVTIFLEDLDSDEFSELITLLHYLSRLKQVHFVTGNEEDLLRLTTAPAVERYQYKFERGTLPSHLHVCEHELKQWWNDHSDCEVTIDMRRWPMSFVSATHPHARAAFVDQE
jgi:hypothetical protein